MFLTSFDFFIAFFGGASQVHGLEVHVASSASVFF